MRKISSLLTLLIAMFTFTFINVKATTREAYNIVTNPGENMSTSMQISYHSDVEGTFVEVTKYEDVDYLEKKFIIRKLSHGHALKEKTLRLNGHQQGFMKDMYVELF